MTRILVMTMLGVGASVAGTGMFINHSAAPFIFGPLFLLTLGLMYVAYKDPYLK